MTLQASGQISINQIRVEMGEVGGNYSLTALSTVPKLNTGASPRPNNAAPHAMSEFYSYNHAFVPSISLSPTLTPSVTPSLTRTPSVTPSRTPSATPSASMNASASPTPSLTATPSVTPSLTRTPSVTPTLTPSISRTPSPTPTPSGSPCFANIFQVIQELPNDYYCDTVGANVNVYANTSPFEVGTRVYTSLGCSGMVNGRYTNGTQGYTIVDSVVTVVGDCIS